MGHEFAGRVADVGDGVSRLQPGDAVAVEPIIACGQCRECRRGSYNLCRQLGFVGLSGWGGGLSEFVVVPEHLAHELRGLPTDLGALVEPVAVGFHAVRKSGFKAGQTALVFGAVPIGLVTTACLRAAGASLVAVAEVAEARKAMARDHGADVVIDPREQDVVETMLDRTGGVGADVSFDAAGTPQTLRTAIAATARGGTAVNIAIWGAPVDLDVNSLVMTEVNLLGVLAYANEHPATIQLMNDGRIDARPFITKRIPIDDVVDEGFGALINHKDEHVKILVQPADTG
jgi:(R,R)-butanediol dehydrogenase/meso-butanediol dehydrogenase/diacetyl reductase